MRSPYVTNGLLWLFLLAVATFAAVYFGAPAPIAFLLGANFAAFGLFFIDKNSANAVVGRVPEIVLYIALWFGMVGGFSGMYLMRHKTRKSSFQLVAWLMLLVQAGLLLWVLQSRGAFQQ
jgi:uncharacterized membrane protein YsdA (DUF1294 family)